MTIVTSATGRGRRKRKAGLRGREGSSGGKRSAAGIRRQKRSRRKEATQN
jgi:hypothetical protein